MLHASTVAGQRLSSQSPPGFARALPVEFVDGTYELAASELEPQDSLLATLTAVFHRWARDAENCIPNMTQSGYDTWLEQRWSIHVLLNREGTVIEVALPTDSQFLRCVRGRLMAHKTEPLDICDNTWVEFPPMNHDWVRRTSVPPFQLTAPDGRVLGSLPPRSCLFALVNQSLERCETNYWEAERVQRRLIRLELEAMRFRDSGP